MKNLSLASFIFPLFFLSLCAGTTAHAKTLKDISYGDAKKQKLDVYLPDNAANSPIMFMVHGGAWRIGDKQNHQGSKGKSRALATTWLSIHLYQLSNVTKNRSLPAGKRCRESLRTRTSAR